MLKSFLILIIGFAPALCICQVAMPDLTTAVISGTDSSEVIRDFKHIIIESSKVLLSWNVSDSSLVEFITIQRSSNGGLFETVGVMKTLKIAGKIEWADEAPPRGMNYYRLNYLSKSSKETYTRTISVPISGQQAFRFYPNPVDNILIIRAEAPLEIQIADGTGKVRVPLTRVTGLYTLNVSSLEKGVYILRIVNKHTNTVVQEKLIKN